MDAEVVGAVFCGDSHFAENEEACAKEALARIMDTKHLAYRELVA